MLVLGLWSSKHNCIHEQSGSPKPFILIYNMLLSQNTYNNLPPPHDIVTCFLYCCSISSILIVTALLSKLYNQRNIKLYNIIIKCQTFIHFIHLFGKGHFQKIFLTLWGRWMRVLIGCWLVWTSSGCVRVRAADLKLVILWCCDLNSFQSSSMPLLSLHNV